MSDEIPEGFSPELWDFANKSCAENRERKLREHWRNCIWRLKRVLETENKDTAFWKDWRKRAEEEIADFEAYELTKVKGAGIRT